MEAAANPVMPARMVPPAPCGQRMFASAAPRVRARRSRGRWPTTVGFHRTQDNGIRTQGSPKLPSTVSRPDSRPL